MRNNKDGPRGIRIIPYYLYEPRKINKTINGKIRRGRDNLTPSIVHMPMCMCNMLVQYHL